MSRVGSPSPTRPIKRPTRTFGKRSRDSDRSQITTDVVNEVRSAALKEIHLDRVEDLGTYKRLLYDVIESPDKVPSTVLHDTHEQRAQIPKVKNTRRRYLGNLEQKDGLIESNGKVYAVSEF